MNLLNKLKNNYWLFAILVLGSILRFYHLDFQSIWLDEIHTMNESNPNTKISELYSAIMSGEQMPPLYFYLLYFVFKIFGYTTLVARLFSAILGVISIFALYKFSKELFNKKVALIASFLLSINSFHLYYSQEARPYILLFLFSILSFYGLVRYIKINNFKNAFIYGFCSGLMLLSHFFGLFVFLSQLFVLLFFFSISEKNNMLDYFKKSLFSCIIVLILFIPALKIFIKVAKIKEFWIPAPTVDVYTLIFKEFFGNSEMVLSLIIIFVLFYFIKLSKIKEINKHYTKIIEDKMLFSFIILAPWISLVLLIPLVRSYLSVPMIISRYFIVVLPALLLLVSIGLIQFKNKIIQFGFISLLFVFTISDMVFVKKYYTQSNKSQFREVSKFINSNLTKDEKIYTTLSWYFQFFFNKPKLINKPINQLINEVKTDTSKFRSFWYINAHGNKFKLNNENEQFINKNYVVDKNYDGFDAWAKRFVLKGVFEQNSSIKKYSPFDKNQYGKNMLTWIENFEYSRDSLKISGWSILKGRNSEESNILVILFNQNEEFIFTPSKITRPDITRVENDGFNYNFSGFEVKTALNNVQKGIFKVGVLIKNNKEEGFFIYEKHISIN